MTSHVIINNAVQCKRNCFITLGEIHGRSAKTRQSQDFQHFVETPYKSIEKGIQDVKDEFDITIEPYYLNDGCSQAQSLDTAIQRFVLLVTTGRYTRDYI